MEELKRDRKDFKQQFRLIKKLNNKENTDNYLVKNTSKFFSDTDNNSELNTFFEKFWNINLKEKAAQNNLLHKQALKNLQENQT